jgi:hypothetical protein
VVAPPRAGKRVAASVRPPFGKRGEAERTIPPPAPRFERRAPSESGSSAPRVSQERPPRATAPAPPVAREAKPSERPRAKPSKRTAPPPDVAPRERPAATTRDLPGEPANRIFRPRQKQKASPQSPPPETRPSPQVQKSGPARKAREDLTIDGGGGPGGKQPGQPRGR